MKTVFFAEKEQLFWLFMIDPFSHVKTQKTLHPKGSFELVASLTGPAPGSKGPFPVGSPQKIFAQSVDKTEVWFHLSKRWKGCLNEIMTWPKIDEFLIISDDSCCRLDFVHTFLGKSFRVTAFLPSVIHTLWFAAKPRQEPRRRFVRGTCVAHSHQVPRWFFPKVHRTRHAAHALNLCYHYDSCGPYKALSSNTGLPISSA